jgi:hypothetical protein
VREGRDWIGLDWTGLGGIERMDGWVGILEGGSGYGKITPGRFSVASSVVVLCFVLFFCLGGVWVWFVLFLQVLP